MLWSELSRSVKAALERSVKTNVHHFKPQGVSNILIGLTAMEVKFDQLSPELQSTLLSILKEKLTVMDEQGVANTIHS